MRIAIAIAGITLATSACFSPNFQEGVPCTVDRECPEGQFCAEDDRCYTPGSEPDFEDGGVVEVCEDGAIECVDGERTVCEGGEERTDSCALGCAEDGQSCIRIDPSNDIESDLEAAFGASDVVLTDNAFINTDTGEIRNGDGTLVVAPFRSVEAPEPDPFRGAPLGVFAFRSLQIGNVAVVGKAALVLVVANEVRIDGTLDLSATSGPAPGALALLGVCAASGGGQRIQSDGFFLSAGGRGASNQNSGGNPGACGTIGFESGALLRCTSGASSFATEELVPLAGGCNGGAAPGSDSEGGGGGAVQIVSNLEIRFGPSGSVLAGGAGGFRDNGEDSNGQEGSGGAGGGSGGGILLEAPTVTLAETAGIAANGGGGGSYVARGADANVLTSNPADGAPGNTFKGAGGAGATRTSEGQNGADRESDVGDSSNRDTAAAGGGGGGGLGRIRINTLGSSFDPPAGVILSPTPSIGALTAQ